MQLKWFVSTGFSDHAHSSCTAKMICMHWNQSWQVVPCAQDEVHLALNQIKASRCHLISKHCALDVIKCPPVACVKWYLRYILYHLLSYESIKISLRLGLRWSRLSHELLVKAIGGIFSASTSWQGIATSEQILIFCRAYSTKRKHLSLIRWILKIQSHNALILCMIKYRSW